MEPIGTRSRKEALNLFKVNAVWNMPPNLRNRSLRIASTDNVGEFIGVHPSIHSELPE